MKLIWIALMGIAARRLQAEIVVLQAGVEASQQSLVALGQYGAIVLFASFLCLPKRNRVVAGCAGAVVALLTAAAVLVWREPQVAFTVALWLSASDLCLAFVFMTAMAYVMRRRDDVLTTDASHEQES